jgi:hypothetical protein
VTHPFARTALVTLALAGAGIAGCGGDDTASDTTTAAAGGQATATATATETATATAPATTTDAATPTELAREAGQKEAAVAGDEQTLKLGDDGFTLKVTKVLDPAVAFVDQAQKGNKFVGVFVEGKAAGAIEATRTTAITTLETSNGKVSGVRIIADGDCGGGFQAGDLLQATEKTAKGCIGFEVPRKATPKAITIQLVGEGGTKQATWKLPKAT